MTTFLASRYNAPSYAHWSLDRQLSAFFLDSCSPDGADGCELAIFNATYAEILAHRRTVARDRDQAGSLT
ncbi:hypothetical protein [Tsukamurella soli]|uniref:hypothetical protein n=1 Tax=Tsukamurella soli TaxID=644556 RepID=UPI0031EC2BF2